MEGAARHKRVSIHLHPMQNTLLSGNPGDLLTEIREMIEALKLSEAHILKTANESTDVRVTAA